MKHVFPLVVLALVFGCSQEFARQMGEGMRAAGATTSKDNYRAYQQQNQFREQQTFQCQRACLD
ncbi:MAG: hypothetical protein JSU95_14000 [Betaproteobacteria bacterium]|nr:MAG: hypothetical protein JSU95_14000 [Betaproteobacteria bacterium]